MKKTCQNVTSDRSVADLAKADNTDNTENMENLSTQDIMKAYTVSQMKVLLENVTLGLVSKRELRTLGPLTVVQWCYRVMLPLPCHQVTHRIDITQQQPM